MWPWPWASINRAEKKISQERMDYEKSLREITMLENLLSYAKERAEKAKIAYEKVGY